MPFAEDLQLFAFLEIFTLPAAINAFIPAANPDVAMLRPSALSTGSLAANFHQSPQYFIAGRIAFKGFKEWDFGEGLRNSIESGGSKLFLSP